MGEEACEWVVSVLKVVNGKRVRFLNISAVKRGGRENVRMSLWKRAGVNEREW